VPWGWPTVPGVAVSIDETNLSKSGERWKFLEFSGQRCVFQGQKKRATIVATSHFGPKADDIVSLYFIFK